MLLISALTLIAFAGASGFKGTCQVRNFRLDANPCKEFSDVNAPIFLHDTTLLLSVAIQVQVVFSVIDSFGENQCNDVFKQFLCVFAFPPCNLTTGQPHPVCEKLCDRIVNGPECCRDFQVAKDAYESMTVASFPVFGSQIPECDTLPYSQNNKETCTSGHIDVTVLDQNQTVQNQCDQNQTVQNQSEQNQASSENKQLWLLVGIPVAGTAVLILFVILVVCVCLHVRHEKNSALSSNIRNRVESQEQHATNQYPVDESTEVVSITLASKWSSSNRCAALNPLVKMKSDRYLVMPKPIENIAVVLEGEDKERIVSIHEQLEELAENLGDLLVDFNQVILHEVLGQGAFGLVQRGSLAKDGQLIQVAIKLLKDTSNMTDVLEFVRESSMMASFHHPNILGVSGVCLDMSNGRSPLILVPFMVNGDLKTFLQKSRIGTKEDEDKTGISGIQLLSFCIQIAQGMEYLSNLPIVHRDLAARNCMLDERMVVKVGDFGLSRDIYSNNYYRMGSKGKVPVKWMAPESLTDNIYTVYTDVWSFGVTMWEIYSHSKVPYPGIPNYEVLEYIENGHRLSKPKLCSTEVFAFALKCWEWNANDRPSFHELNEELSRIAGDQAGYLRPIDWRGSGSSDKPSA